MEVFRKKSIDRVSDPEKLNDYIRVTNPGVWLVLLAVLILLLGMLAWSIFSSVEVKESNGEVKEIHPITLVTN